MTVTEARSAGAQGQWCVLGEVADEGGGFSKRRFDRRNGRDEKGIPLGNEALKDLELLGPVPLERKQAPNEEIRR